MATLLNKFALLFETNAKQASIETKGLDKSLDDVTKGLKDADKSTEKLSKANFKLNKATKAIRQEYGKLKNDLPGINLGFDDLTGAVAGAAAAYLTFSGIKGLSIDNAAAIDAMGKLAERTGESAGQLYIWGEAAARFGGSAEGMYDDLVRLNDMSSDYANNGGGAAVDTFKRFNMQMRNTDGTLKTSSQLILELADNVKGLSKQEISGIGEQLGFSSGTVAMLQQGRAAIEAQIARQKQLGTITKEATKNSAAFNDQLADVAQIFKVSSYDFTSFLLPALTKGLKVVEEFTLYLRDNKNLVTGFFIAIAGVLSVLYIPAMVSAAAATLAATWPIIAIGAVVAALGAAFAFAYDDIMNFAEGNNSMLGDLVKKYPQLQIVIDTLIDTFKFLWEAIKTTSEYGVNMVEGFIAVAGRLLNIFTQFWIDFADSPKQAFVNMLNSVEKLVNDIIGKFTGMFDKVTGLWDKLPSFDSVVPDFLKGNDSVTPATNNNQPDFMPAFGTGSAIPDSLGGKNAALNLQSANAKAAVTNANVNPLNTMDAKTAVAAGYTSAAAGKDALAGNGSTSTTNTTTNNNDINLTINTQATDGKAIAGDIYKGLNYAMEEHSTGEKK